MGKYLNRFYEIIDKIGRHNFILILFILIALITTGLYQTFSFYTESEGMSLIDGIKTYSFILNASNTTNSVTIAAGNSKYVDITVSNESATSLKYGLYSSIASSSDVKIGYRSSTANIPTGVIPGNKDYVVTIRVDNNSSSSVTVNFGLKYGFEDGGDLVLDSGQYWLEEYSELLLLNSVAVGSYVAYTGNNGCTGNACNGQNANYVSDTDMGYCNISNEKFDVTGWRVGYIENGKAHLVSAGAPECVATATYISNKSSNTDSLNLPSGTVYYFGSGYTFDENTGRYSLTGVTDSALNWGTNYTNIINNTPYTCKSSSSTDTCAILYEIDEYDYSDYAYAYEYSSTLEESSLLNHIEHLNDVALTYCNSSYVDGGTCNSSTAWAMAAADFESITNSTLSSDSCYGNIRDAACGYGNDLIANGGQYWFAISFNSDYFHWEPFVGVKATSSTADKGVRPVIALDSSVFVTGGSGTYADPYIISNE